LALGRVWDKVLGTVNSGALTNAQVWGIPQELVDSLHEDVVLCAALLGKVKSPQATRPDRDDCRAAFGGLKKTMRALHRYFYLERFPSEYLGSLGLPHHDGQRSEVHKPVSQFTLVVVPSNLHQQTAAAGVVGTKARRMPDDVEGLRWGWQVGGAKPAKGADLPHSVFSRRMKRVFDWSEDMRAQTVYYAVCGENAKGDQGEWSDVVETTVS
jgi:hypothetical protein